MKAHYARYYDWLTGIKAPRLLLFISSIFTALIVMQAYPGYLHSIHDLHDNAGNILGRDFAGVWTAVILMKNAGAHSIYSAALYTEKLRELFAIDGQPWVYPPHYLFVVWPFTFMADYKISYALWSVLNIAAYMFAMCWRSPLALTWRWIIAFAPCVLMSLFIGQNGLLTAALLIGGFRLLLPAPWLAGVLFALLSFKPQLGILIPFILLALHHYKAFAGAVLTIVMLVILSSLAFGWQCWQAFFASMWHMHSQVAELITNRLISLYSAVLILGVPALYPVIALLLGVLLCYRLAQIRHAHWTDWLRISLPAIYLVTPYLFIYDLCALSAGWVFWLQQHNGKKVSLAGTLIWLALWFMPFASGSLSKAGTMGLPLTPILLLLAFILAWRETTPARLSVNP